MSSNLYWEPAERKKYNAGTDQALKWVLQKRYGYPVHITMTTNDIPYLQGLADAKINGAQELIEAIEKYSDIELFEE